MPPGRVGPKPIENPDIFEDVDYFLSVEARFMDFTDTVHFLLVLTLLKVKILLDLKDLQKARQTAGPNVPAEILDKILENIPRSSAVRANRRIMETDDLSDEIAKLDKQVDELYQKILETNYYWWRTLVDQPKDAMKTVLARARGGAPPEFGSPLEAAVWINQRSQRFSWFETPGALEFIREKNSHFELPRLSETRRVYGRRADELVRALYGSDD
ncbi:hypothetical protein N7456_000975 [Penicillium angulare]|uniref:Uncharacterized protein n=1 Tax=Penicillium angulare TaxID=116970 RepID=A0A9W9KRE9_9EURO|nr:hypothetical protein N7456_000975 [Penicillium angulare]